MTFYQGGLALARCAEHEHAAEIDSTARLTLIAMANFASEKNDVPECFAARATIAARAGVDVATVRRALPRLERLGLIERAGKRGKTVRWRLLLLDALGVQGEPQGELGSSTSSTHGTRSDNRGRLPHKNRVAVPHKNRVAVPHNPSESSEGLPKEDDSGARPPAAPSSDRRRLAGWVAEQLDMTREEAEVWIKQRMAAAVDPVRSPPHYIEKCVTAALAGDAPRAGSAKGQPDQPALDDDESLDDEEEEPMCLECGTAPAVTFNHRCGRCSARAIQRRVAEREAQRRQAVREERELRAAKGEVMLTLAEPGKAYSRRRFSESAKQVVLLRDDSPFDEPEATCWGDLRVGDVFRRAGVIRWYEVVEREEAAGSSATGQPHTSDSPAVPATERNRP